MTTPLDEAKADLGYKEGSNNENKYGEWYGMNNVAYCMQAVQYWHDKAGYTLPYKTASCSALLNWYRKNKPESVTNTPKESFIAIFNFGHAGMVESFTEDKVTCIEANTSVSGSQNNGDGVYRKTRNRSTVTAYINGMDYDDKVVVDTATLQSETIRLNKAIQKVVGANQDGEIGEQTFTDIAVKIGAEGFPFTRKIYGVYAVVCNDVKVFASPKKGLSAFANSINGSFYGSDGKPCAICVSDGKAIREVSAHYWDGQGYPETVIYKTTAGVIGVKRVKSVKELPAKLSWAVGGLGLLDNYNPTAEGFCKIGKADFSDVLRKTNHTMLGAKRGKLYLCYCPNMTAASVNAKAKTLGLEMAIMLDGGHIAAFNGAGYSTNTKITQYYVLQGV